MSAVRRLLQKEVNSTRIRDVVESSLESLRGGVRDQQSSQGRISFWNRLFPDCAISVTTDIGQHLVDVLRRHLVRLTSAHRFAFEISALFVDLPCEFLRFISVFPFPYTVALKIAFRTIHDHLEYAERGNIRDFISKVLPELSPTRIGQFSAAVKCLQQDVVNSDRAIHKLCQILSPENFDMLLAVVPPHLHLRWALKHGRPLPEFQINFASLPVPFEFLQAIVDIEGVEAADTLIVLQHEGSKLNGE
jgi:hypothetical protein